MTTSPAMSRVVAEIAKAADLRTHVRVVEIDSVKVVELRDYIPSLDEYGRGYWLPLTEESVFGVMNALQEIVNSGELS